MTRYMRGILCGLMLTTVLAARAQVNTKNFEDEDNGNTLDAALIDTLRKDSLNLPWPQSVQLQLDRLVGSDMFKTSQLGLMVYDLTADSAIYCYNERQMMRPASTMKVITAITALDRLGGSYQFKTDLCYTGKVENGTLTGDVYCVGHMDPRFNSDDMNAFVESLQKMGVDTIRGRLYADKSFKEATLLGEGWCWDDDNPELSALPYGRKDKFMERFERELREAGIIVQAYSTVSAKPDSAYCICTRFHTMDQILMKMMKESDNLYAESMFYQLAASTGDRPATAADGRKLVHRLIDKIGLKGSAYKIADGSGLSLYNYVSPELEVRMLRYARQNQNIYLHLLPSLPKAGMDGTLRNRMSSTFTRGNVRAKTGSVTGVYSLAGYLTASNGHEICFSIINQGIMHGKNARAFQDRICEALCMP